MADRIAETMQGLANECGKLASENAELQRQLTALRKAAAPFVEKAREILDSNPSPGRRYKLGCFFGLSTLRALKEAADER